MKDLTSTSFGYLIGFLLPGLVALYGLGFWSSRVQKILAPAATTDATVGPSVFLLLAALATGLLVSAIRCIAFEKWLCKKDKLEKITFAKLGASETLTSFKAVVDEHYRYHQFYGGVAISSVITYGGWVWDVHSSSQWYLVVASSLGFLIFEYVVVISAVDAYRKYVQRGNSIVNGDDSEVAKSIQSKGKAMHV